MSTSTTTTTTTTTAQIQTKTTDDTSVPRGPVQATISFVVPWPTTPLDKLYNYVEDPPAGEHKHNFDEVPFQVNLTDIRGTEDTYTLDNNAFAVLKGVHTDTTYQTYFDDKEVERVYYPEVEKLLLDNVPGAHKIVIFDHTIRRQGPGAARQPVNRAHVDQTPAAAAERVRIHVPDKSEAEDLLKGRFRIINVWRPINGTVVSAPLALADVKSIVPERDLVNIQHRYPHRNGEIMGVLRSQEQRWLYVSGVEGGERLLLKCADSAEGSPIEDGVVEGRAPHSAFTDPRSVEGKGGKPRESIEVRALVFG